MNDPSYDAALRDARECVDQAHPWIPGYVFDESPELKTRILAWLAREMRGNE